ncbi:PilW family protein [Pandoraea communis]|uniref:Transmembrane protein n=1 Tax=Pandoraea communis TaxID=2508297 RepID=A0A5E4WHK2_9BURK|nr:PilW family protein [Pandoraea communis]MDM8359380.1 PilW family protein [Pandoraea communis]VVE23000.1 transmembrane protein [Pandoraea communis]
MARSSIPVTWSPRLGRGNKACVRRMAGFTLLEWVLAMPLGLLIVTAAIAIYLAGIRLWRVQAERYDVTERAIFALTQLTRAVGMAGYRNWDPMEGAIWPPGPVKREWPSLRASAACAGTVDTCARSGWQGSSLLEVQFQGAGLSEGNGAIHNCAGVRTRATGRLDDRHLSIFYVDKGEDEIPSLYCRYGERQTRSTDLHPAQVLVSGVEAMYVRLGFRVGGTGPLRWVEPVRSMRRRPPSPPPGEGGWENVAAVAFSLVLRGAPRSGGKPRTTRVVEVFDAASGGREYKRLGNAGDVHLHVFNAVAYRRNDGGVGEEAKWLASSW